MKPNVVFIGMMGTFKTAVAERAAAHWGMPLIDTDQVFEERFTAVGAYFEQYGEAAFRLEEKRIVAESAQKENVVISCGGGVVLDPVNMEVLSANGIVVLLTASDEAIVRRVGKAETRPLLKADVEQNVRRISAERRDLYTRYAEIFVDNTHMTSTQCCERVIQLVEAYRARVNDKHL